MVKKEVLENPDHDLKRKLEENKEEENSLSTTSKSKRQVIVPVCMPKSIIHR